ncbi:MAG: PAS domain S-box protein [Xenococcaceae cyanobacterium MO_234.B1]|nr:PAS domain S-box protein [Xenococcaceae cyanobacterium MO_234.B1]
MNEFLAILPLHTLATVSFMPHGMCYLWKPWLVGLHLVSDGVIALSYFSIPVTLLYILRKRADIPFNGIFLLFAAFILCCGTGHGFDIWTLWHPNYWVSGWIRFTTALVSLTTAIALAVKIPQILTLPSPTQMENVNQQLQEKIAELEKKETTIRQQEQFLRSIYDNVREAIFVVDIESDETFRYQGFNSAAEKLTGVKDVENKTPAQILPPEVAAAVEKRYTECIASKISISYEECLPFQGEDTWWLTTLNPIEDPIEDETGKIYRIIGTSLNISDRKRAEIELDKEKNFLQALLDNLSDGIVSCDRNGVLTLFNQATKEFHGLPPQAIPADKWAEYYDLYLPDGKTMMSQEDIPLFRALQGESVRDVEMMIIPKQGKPRTLLANGDPIIAPDGQKIGAVVAMRDISELKKIEQVLWESQARFLETFIHAAVGMAIVALDGSWLEVNPALCQMVGYSEAELQATNFQAITYPEDLDGDLAKVKQLLGGQIPSYQMEKRYVHKQGSLVWINLSVSLVKDKNNQPLYFVALIQNIDERKQAEQALVQLNDELEARVQQRTIQLEQVNKLLLGATEQLRKSNQELEQFAYVASHDLKAPLRAIANLSEWIEEDLEDKLDDDTRHQMNLLRSRVHRLENLINGLLAYSRIGRLKSEPQEVAVEEILAEIIDLLDVPDSFQIQIQGDLPTFVTELIPLQQVFNNLISNAIKHSDLDRGQITISAKEQDHYYEFAVADNGKGIAPEHHERIFTIFQTLEARDTKESTGIGLAIVKKAVENQGGKIWVESQLGEGATFRFTWQKTQGEEP